jgi:D-alanine-D-alanine ligase
MKRVIAVLFGGRSVEHEVSVVSSLQAIHSFNKDKYDIVPVYITKNGQWYTGSILLNIENYKDIPSLLNRADKIYLSSNSDESCLHYADKKIKSPLPFNRIKTQIHIDVFFPITHGTNVEDGILQGVLENANIPYVGSNVIGSAVNMDKIMMKHVFKSSKINALDFVWFHRQEWIENSDAIITKIKALTDFPYIIKPAIAGSSIGVKKASTLDELYEAIELASKYCPKIIVEKYVSNMMEINCSVLGTSFRQKVSVCERPLGSKEILDYNDKYIRESSSKSSSKSSGMVSMDRVIPADIPDELTKEIQELAKAVFRELYCSGVARIDFIIDKSTNILYVNELNGIPGSLSFYLWEKSGLSYPQLLDELIDIALENYRIKQETIYSIDSNLLSLQSAKGRKLGNKN